MQSRERQSLGRMVKLYCKKTVKGVFSFCIFLAMIFSLPTTSFSANSKESICYQQTAKLLANQSPNGVSSIGGEWLVIGLARGNCAVSKDFYSDYSEKVRDIIKEKSGVLSATKYTEYSRVILALTSIGEDVTNALGYNLLSYLADFTKVKRQGINGAVWALIALDSNNYSVPTGESTDNTTREKLIDYILGKKLSTGGWTLVGNTPDPDVTAMAITALSKYYNSNKEVKSAVDKGITVLSDIQKSSGNFSSGGVVNSESVSQVIVCLSSLGINPNTDKRFICDGKSLVDVLLSFSVNGGGFAHQKGGEYNQMATEQGFYALVAYNRLLSKKAPLFDMTDVFKGDNNADDENVGGSKTPQGNITQKGKKNNSNNNSNSVNNNIDYPQKSNNTPVNSSNSNGENTNTNNSNEQVKNGDTSGVSNISNTSNISSKEKTKEKSLKESTANNKNSNGEKETENSANSLQNKEQSNSLDKNAKQQKNKKQESNSSIIIYIILSALLLLIALFVVLRVIKRSKKFMGEKQ